MSRRGASLMRPEAPTSHNVERIIHAATDLVLAHGARRVTMAEMARAAGVGKGTAYQYWPTKDDLILDMAVREAVECLDEIAADLQKDPEHLSVGRSLRLVIDTAVTHPLLTRVLQRTDPDLMRLIAERSWSRQAFAACAPPALCGTLLPILRAHGLVHDEAVAGEQTFAAVSMTLGFFTTITAADELTANRVDDPGGVFERSVQAVLGPTSAPEPDEVRAASTEIITSLDGLRTNLATEPTRRTRQS